MNKQNKSLLKIRALPVINKLDPDSTLRVKLSTKTLPVGVTTWKQIVLMSENKTCEYDAYQRKNKSTKLQSP